MTGRCIIEARPRYSPDALDDPRADGRRALKSACDRCSSCRCTTGGRVVGVLKLLCSHRDAFRESDLLTVQLLAGPISIGLAWVSHGIGDQCLQLAVSSLEAAGPPGDALARRSGDEFVVLLPNLLAADAQAVLAHLQSVVCAAGTLGQWPTNAEEVLRATDSLLYRAKGAGGGEPSSAARMASAQR